MDAPRHEECIRDPLCSHPLPWILKQQRDYQNVSKQDRDTDTANGPNPRRGLRLRYHVGIHPWRHACRVLLSSEKRISSGAS